MPVEPPPTPWELPAPETADDRGVVGIGADLEPGTLLAAYRSGLFPMPVDGGVVAWWSPDPRGVLPLDGLKVSRSLRQAVGRFEVSVDRAFPAVIEACADPTRPHGWINEPIVAAYTRLHELGWAHSIEVWEGDDLVGGLYGVAVGGLFAGESMFHHRPRRVEGGPGAPGRAAAATATAACWTSSGRRRTWSRWARSTCPAPSTSTCWARRSRRRCRRRSRPRGPAGSG